MTPTLFSGIHGMPLAGAMAQINPFVAILPGGMVGSRFGSAVSVFSLQVPAWIATVVFAVIIIRLTLTGAALRLALYGGGLVASLRRQLLLATFLGGLVAGSLPDPSSLGSGVGHVIPLSIASCIIFAIAAFSLPSLFVPAINDDLPVGETVEGRYDVRAAFAGKHSGALPYFHIWLLVLIAGAAAGHMMDPASGLDAELFSAACATFFYLSGLGFLLWSLGRRAAWMTTTAAAARQVSFFILLFIILVPGALMLAENTMSMGAPPLSPVRLAWLLYPFTEEAKAVPQDAALFIYGALAYVLGALFYPFWRSVTPGAGSRRSRSAIKGSA
jgi:hypothetical protein